MIKSKKVFGIIFSLVLILGLCPIVKSRAAELPQLNSYIVFAAPPVDTDEYGSYVAHNITKVKKPLYIVAEAGGKLYGTYFTGLNYDYSNFPNENSVEFIDLGSASDVQNLGSKLGSSKCVKIDTADTYLASTIITADTVINIEKYHVYTPEGQYIGPYSYPELVDSSQTETESRNDDPYKGKGEVKIINVEKNKVKGYVELTVAWDFTKTQNEDEYFQDVEFKLLDKNGDYISEQTQFWSPPTTSDDILIKGQTTIQYTKSGKAVITLNSSTHIYKLERNIDLSDYEASQKTPEPEKTPKPSIDIDEDDPNAKLVVTFDKFPHKVLKGTAVNITMNTNLRAMKTFGGQRDASYNKCSNFVVKENGTYSYVAETKSGKKVEGKISINFFVNDTDNLGLDDYFSDPNAPADGEGTLPQTGGTPWYHLVLAGIIIALAGVFGCIIYLKGRKQNKE